MTRRSFPWLVLLGLAGCTRAPAEPPDQARAADEAGAGQTAASLPSAPPSGRTFDPPPSFPRVERSLLWNDPPDFQREEPRSPARVAEYTLHRVGPDQEDAECVVMTFGPHQGGTVDENVKRWMDQFNPALPTPRRMTKDINGLHVTFVEVAGTFAGNMMPNQKTIMPKNKPGWRMIGAIVESPTGLWFFKLTGPDLTVRAGAREFEDMVRSIRPK